MANAENERDTTMADIDYALAWQFISEDGRPRQMRFRQNYAPPGDARVFDDTGQLVAVVADSRRVDNGDEIAISRPNVRFDDVEKAIDGWQEWATLHADDYGIDRCTNLVAICRRINDAGLGMGDTTT